MRLKGSVSFLGLFLTLLIAVVLPPPSLSVYDAGDSDIKTFKSTSDFTSQVLDSDSIWLVQFYAPWCGHCKNFAPIYKQIAYVFKGIVNVAAIDAATEGPLQSIAAKYKVEGFPTIYIFANDKTKPKKYTGNRDSEAMINYVLQEIVQTLQSRSGAPSEDESSSGGGGGTSVSEVINLTTSTFSQIYDSKDVWLVAFIAPWCGHCKALKPEWQSAAKKLKGSGAKLAVVDATAEESLAQQFQIQGFPTIKVFKGGDKSGPKDAMDYQGDRKAPHIVQYALQEVDRSGVPKEIVEMTSLDVLKENCDEANKICILAALPHILDSMAAGRRKYFETLQTVQKKFRTHPIDFLWFEGSSQLKLEEALQLTFGYPAVVAVSMDKQVYGVMHGSFTERSITMFITSILSGKVGTVKLGTFPKVETVEPWDGEDGVPFEEEPLDDIMGWDEEGEL